jgi:hypothetical protein
MAAELMKKHASRDRRDTDRNHCACVTTQLTPSLRDIQSTDR